MIPCIMLLHLKLSPLKYKIRAIRKQINYTLQGACVEEGDIFRLAITQYKLLLWEMIPSSFKGLAARSDIVC